MLQPSAVIAQYLNELMAWKRSIADIQDKNIILKSRLSAIVKFLDSRSPALIEKMEYFYDLLLREDEITGFLSDEIKSHATLLEKEAALPHAGAWTDGEKRQNDLGRQVLKTTQEFTELTAAFNRYAEEVLLC